MQRTIPRSAPRRTPHVDEQGAQNHKEQETLHKAKARKAYLLKSTANVKASHAEQERQLKMWMAGLQVRDPMGPLRRCRHTRRPLFLSTLAAALSWALGFGKAQLLDAN